MREAPGSPSRLISPRFDHSGVAEKLAKHAARKALASLRKSEPLTVSISLLHQLKFGHLGMLKDFAVKILRPQESPAISSAGGVARSDVDGNFSF